MLRLDKGTKGQTRFKRIARQKPEVVGGVKTSDRIAGHACVREERKN